LATICFEQFVETWQLFRFFLIKKDSREYLREYYSLEGKKKIADFKVGLWD
jgi:hypothetical protein